MCIRERLNEEALFLKLIGLLSFIGRYPAQMCTPFFIFLNSV